MSRRTERRTFGQITKLPSGRYRARYADPDGRLVPPSEKAMRSALAEGRPSPRPEPLRHSAPVTFDTKADAEAWLTDERRLISAGTWTAPAVRKALKLERPLMFGEYAEAWLKGRKVKGRPLASTTRDHYRDLLNRLILPAFADVPLSSITPPDVDRWYETTATGTPTMQAHAYGLLRTILGTAADRGLIGFNPAKVRGGGTVKRAHDVKPATLDELAVIVAAMPERRRLMIQLAAWCGLRFGELAELRRGDIDTKAKVIHVRRGVVRVRAETKSQDGPAYVRQVKKPKTDAGIRKVPIPPHLLDDVRAHLLARTAPGRDGLLFPGNDDGDHLTTSGFYGRATTYHGRGPRKGQVKRTGHGWYAARQAAGREDLRFHDLRHTGLTNAAVAGATIAELMRLAGHSTPGAAMRYQHAVDDRMQALAAKLSILAKAGDQ